MSVFVILSPEEIRLELAADALILAHPQDSSLPAYTERQLARRGRRMIPVDSLAEMTAAPSQSLRDELRFLASVSRLSAELRGCLNLWIDGWTQQEIAQACAVSQQRVSQRLRAALRICYDAAPLSFRRFSYHTIYRPPRRIRKEMITRRCARCGEEFPLGNGAGRYCSTSCREAARRAD